MNLYGNVNATITQHWAALLLNSPGSHDESEWSGVTVWISGGKPRSKQNSSGPRHQPWNQAKTAVLNITLNLVTLVKFVETEAERQQLTTAVRATRTHACTQCRVGPNATVGTGYWNRNKAQVVYSVVTTPTEQKLRRGRETNLPKWRFRATQSTAKQRRAPEEA